MRDKRPQKETMRGLWVDAVGAAEGNSDGPPLYLTLPGADGLDVQRLIDAGLLELAENDAAIAAGDLWKVVAIERSTSAYMALRKRWQGLRILNDDLKAVLASTGPLRWPLGERERWCRAHVVNLDMDGAFVCEREEDMLTFPTVRLITKLAQLHMKRPAVNWVLCLTLAAQIDWALRDCEDIQRFLGENFRREERFAQHSRKLLGDRLFEALLDDRAVDMRRLHGQEQQALLMVLVPKKIVAETHGQGWSITTTHNLRYGGARRSQRMVSWMMSFRREARVAAEPHAVYSESLANALTNVGRIATDGRLQLG